MPRGSNNHRFSCQLQIGYGTEPGPSLTLGGMSAIARLVSCRVDTTGRDEERVRPALTRESVQIRCQRDGKRDRNLNSASPGLFPYRQCRGRGGGRRVPLPSQSRELKVVKRWARRRWKGLTGRRFYSTLKNLLNGHVSGQGQVKGQNVVLPRLGTWRRRLSWPKPG